MKVLETHDPQEAEKSLQQALSELERLANDHKVNNPMAVFITRNRSWLMKKKWKNLNLSLDKHD